MFDDDDEYFDREPVTASPVHQGIAVVFGMALVLVALLW